MTKREGRWSKSYKHLGEEYRDFNSSLFSTYGLANTSRQRSSINRRVERNTMRYDLRSLNAMLELETSLLISELNNVSTPTASLSRWVSLGSGSADYGLFGIFNDWLTILVPRGADRNVEYLPQHTSTPEDHGSFHFLPNLPPNYYSLI